jgi:hypothetical protein
MKYDYGVAGKRYRQGNPKYSVCKRSPCKCHFVYQGHSALDRFFAASKFAATVTVLLYISKSTNWKESLDKISKECGVVVVKFVTSKKPPKA